MIVIKNEDHEHYMIFCPGCKHGHVFKCGPDDKPQWGFNGDMESPTFTGSMLVHNAGGKFPNVKRCHSFVENGRIRFLSDCEHDLVGQTVDLEHF